MNHQNPVQFSSWHQEAIRVGQPFLYSKQNPIVHNTINLSTLFLILLGYLMCALLSLYINSWTYLALAFPTFGFLHFMLYILVVHEASHGMFLIGGKNSWRKLLNKIAGWTIVIPFGHDYHHHWEKGHMTHHVHPIENIDPQNCPNTILTGKKLYVYLTKALLIPGWYQFLHKYDNCPEAQNYPFNPFLIVSQILFWVLFISLSSLYLSWLVPLAYFFGIQVLGALNQFRIAMEHGGTMSRAESTYLRSATSHFFLRPIITPLNISFHFEHHLLASVPWYNLPKFHRALEEVIPDHIQSQIYNRNINEVYEVVNAGNND